MKQQKTFRILRQVEDFFVLNADNKVNLSICVLPTDPTSSAIPCKKPKFSKSGNSEILHYLQEKTAEENKLRHEELEFKKAELEMAKERLELEKKKIEVDSQERRARLETENSQVSTLLKIIQEKVLK